MQLETKETKELEWFFNYSQSDCGEKSNWNSMVQSAFFPEKTTYKDPYSTSILNSVDKRRKIQDVFKKLPNSIQLYLEFEFGFSNYPKCIQFCFADLTAAAIFSQSESKQKLNNLINLCNRKIQSKQSIKDSETISRIRMEALEIKTFALNSYKQAKIQNQKQKKESK